MQPETKKFLQALAILIGTIVGVGTFGIPQVFAHAGFLVGAGYLMVMAAVILAMHLIYGEITLRTHEKHRLIGYAETYLGRKGKHIASFVIISIFGTLLAYVIVGGAFSQVLFGSLVVLPASAWSLLFYAVMAFFVITDFKTGAPAELAMNAVLLTVFVVIIGRTLPDVTIAHLAAPGNVKDFFLPYGVVFFALAGGAAVPELRDVLGGDRRMQKVIAIGTLVPAFLYGLFALGVVGSLGKATTAEAVSGLVAKYGAWVSVAGGTVGVLTVATSFIVLALVLKHSFMYDLHLPKSLATALVLGVPLTLFAVATHDFVKVIGFVGSVFGGIEGLLMLTLHRAARARGQRPPEYAITIPRALYYLIGAMFVAGIVYEIIYTLRA